MFPHCHRFHHQLTAAYQTPHQADVHTKRFCKAFPRATDIPFPAWLLHRAELHALCRKNQPPCYAVDQNDAGARRQLRTRIFHTDNAFALQRNGRLLEDIVKQLFRSLRLNVRLTQNVEHHDPEPLYTGKPLKHANTGRISHQCDILCIKIRRCAEQSLERELVVQKACR